MKKIIYTLILVIGFTISATSQVTPIEKGQVYTVDSSSITLKNITSTNQKGIRVIKSSSYKKGRDTYTTLILETKQTVVFKNGVCIGGIK